MKPNNATFTIEELAALRAARLGISLKEALATFDDEPDALVSNGMETSDGDFDGDDLDEDDREWLKARYPGPQCLNPGQIFAYGRSGDLATEQWDHVAKCSACTEVLAIAELNEESLNSFLKVVRESAPKKRRAPAALSRGHSGNL